MTARHPRATVRLCLDCWTRCEPTLGSSRCVSCERRRQRRRNEIRVQYKGGWRTLSRRARAAQPWCTRCGALDDLTLDHETLDVECRSCNASHRRDA